jgi:hypothetical protein
VRIYEQSDLLKCVTSLEQIVDDLGFLYSIANVDLDYLKGQIHDNKIDAVIVSRLSKSIKRQSTSAARTISFPMPTTAASTAITARFTGRFILRTICAKTPLFALKPICIPCHRQMNGS